jgi:hypothetical protein
MDFNLRRSSACCMLSRLAGGYTVDFFANPLLQYSELLMHTWSEEAILELAQFHLTMQEK